MNDIRPGDRAEVTQRAEACDAGVATLTVGRRDRHRIGLTLNGRQQSFDVVPSTTLVDLLRESAGLTGVKKGCDHGQCGACTVILDGQRVNSCLKLAIGLDGASVTTVEGLGTGGRLDPLQQAFIEHDALQCGYCTPGQLCSARALVDEGTVTTRAGIREAMSGNLCRCGAYTNIVDAIADVMGLPAEKGAAK